MNNDIEKELKKLNTIDEKYNKGKMINVNNKIKSTGKRTAVVYRSSFF